MVRAVVKRVRSGRAGDRLPGNHTLILTREHKKTPPGDPPGGVSTSAARRLVVVGGFPFHRMALIAPPLDIA